MSNNGDGYYKNISNEGLFALIQQQAAELGRTPKLKEFDPPAATATAIRRFGKWNNFLASAGLETRTKGNAPMSDEEAIQLVQSKAAELGWTPKRTEFTPARSVIKKYGGWKEFLRAAGLEPAEMKEYKQISDEQLIKLVHVRAAELGRTPKRYEFVQGPTAAIRYGSWSMFLQAANLEPTKVKRNKKQKKQISDEQLIELVQARATELGRTPKRYEFVQGSTATIRYGSWQNFLTSAGLTMEKRRKKQKRLSDKQLIELVKARAAELGRLPQKYEFAYNKTACDRFGGWQSFLFRARLINEKPKVYKKLISNEQLVELVRAQAAELGRLPKKKEFKHGDQAVSRYGSWINFLQVADLNPKITARVSEEELIEGIRKLASELGYTPHKKEFQHGNYAAAKYAGWKKFIQAAGLPPSKMKRQISDEQLVGLIRAKTIELGRVPKKAEYSYCKTAINRFGDWSNFMRAAEQMPAAVEKDSPKFSNNQLIQLIKAQMEELGRTPNILEFEYAELAKARFRSWERFLKRAGLEPAVIEPDVLNPEILKTDAPGKRKARISNEQLIEMVQVLAEELGRTPKRKEFSKASSATRHFGSWSAFIKRAGLEPAKSLSSGYRLSKEQLIELVQAKAEELGRTPKRKEFSKASSAIRRFGNWSVFIESADLEPTKVVKPSSQFSREQLIELLQAQAEKLGRVPKMREFSNYSLAIRRFGSWNAFLESADLGLMKLVESSYRFSKEQLIELVQAQAKELGRAPKRKEFPKAQSAIRYFGSWSAFLESVDLESAIRAHQKARIIREQLVEQVKSQTEELGRAPKKQEFSKPATAVRYFGSWNAFLESANLELSQLVESSYPFSKEQLIELLQAQTTKLGRAPKKQEFPKASSAIYHFGSWNDFLEKADLELAQLVESGYLFSKEQLNELLQVQVKELGRVPKRKEFPKTSLATERFGSWSAFIESASLDPAVLENQKTKISKEQLTKMFQARIEELGRIPKVEEFPEAQSAIRQFGSWRAFKESAGLEPAALVKQKTKIKKEQLIKLVQAQAEELGRTPKGSEFPKTSIIPYYFGSWTAFIESAGLEPTFLVNQEDEISNEQLIELIQAQTEELGRIPKKKEFLKPATAIRRFGSWTTFIESAGLKRERKARTSKEQLIEMVQAKAEELGRTPKMKEFPEVAAAIYYFKTWSSFVESAGLEPRTSGVPKATLTKEKLIELVQVQAEELERTPSVREFQKFSSAIHYFGSWSAFIESAGLKPDLSRRKKVNLSNEQLLEEIKKRALQLGRTPNSEEFEYGSIARYRFGTWNTFLLEAGLDPAGKSTS